MTLDHVFQLGALLVAAATLLLNYSDLRHRREAHGPAPSPPPPTTAPPPSATPPAPPPTWVSDRDADPWGLPRRVVSHLIDFYAPLIPMMIVSSYAVDELGEPVPGHEATWGAVQFLFWGLVVTQVVASGLTGRTLGRVVMGGRLVDARSGEPIGIWRVLGHSVPLMLLAAVPALGAYRSQERRGFHDDWVHARFVSTRIPAPAHAPLVAS